MIKLECLLRLNGLIETIENHDQVIKQDKDYSEEFHGRLLVINALAKERARIAIKEIGLELFQEMG